MKANVNSKVSAKKNVPQARTHNSQETPRRVEGDRRAKSGMPTLAQQEALIMKYRMKARKLGRSILRGWHSRLDIEDVDSLVDLSLCEAVRRFDPYKGASFMTFLYYHLKGNLVRAVAHAASAHSVPVFNPEDEEAMKENEQFLGYQFRPLNAMEVSEALYSSDEPLPDEALWKKELQEKSAEACNKLDKLEQDIINRIFLHEEQIMEIASSLGYSRCHISRVKKRALDTLHDELRSSLKTEDLGRKPIAEEEKKVETNFRVSDRRTIHRRRPRSRKLNIADSDIAAVA